MSTDRIGAPLQERLVSGVCARLWCWQLRQGLSGGGGGGCGTRPTAQGMWVRLPGLGPRGLQTRNHEQEILLVHIVFIAFVLIFNIQNQKNSEYV